MRTSTVLIRVVGLCILALVPVVRAADTIEPFDPGATDLEFYMGSFGLGAAAPDRETVGEVVIGYGITDRVSGFMAVAMVADGRLVSAGNDLVAGGYGTILDRGVAQLDLMMTMGSDGRSGLAVRSGIEGNLDFTANGLYTRIGLCLSPREADKASRAPGVGTAVEWTLGGYVDMGARSQWLLEFDVVRHDAPVHGGEHWEFGGLALGFNTEIATGIELITETSLDLPQDGERRTWGVSLGFISTLPTAGR